MMGIIYNFFYILQSKQLYQDFVNLKRVHNYVINCKKVKDCESYHKVERWTLVWLGGMQWKHPMPASQNMSSLHPCIDHHLHQNYNLRNHNQVQITSSSLHYKKILN